MKNKVLAVILLAVVSAMAIIPITGCKKETKEWWEDAENVVIRVYDELADPEEILYQMGSGILIEMTYTYDGQKHIPQAEAIYEGEIKAYGKIIMIESYNERIDQWDIQLTIVSVGKYRIHYRFYTDPEQKNLFAGKTCFIDVTE